MHIDKDGNMVFPTAKGKMYYGSVVIMLLISLIVLGIAFYLVLTNEDGASAFAVIGLATSFLLLSVFLLMRSFRYTFEKNGIRLHNAKIVLVSQEFIPYRDITRFYETDSFWDSSVSPVTSLDMVVIVFTNENGRRGDAVSVSPKDKALFLSELTKRTGIQISKDPHAEKK
jgi:membrane protein YdbS with pleckstrin-like domain